MPQSPYWGATPQEWRLFSEVLGLTADLLPVVSNPEAKVSANSTIRQLGKTPSLYNPKGMVVGIPKWTSKIADATEIAKWRSQPDLGICIQTRHLRAIDIDVDDETKAQAIRAFFEQHLEEGLPVRWRQGSGKCLLAFIVEGEFPKRVIKVNGGIVEVLGDGQQFIASGTHPKGQRYQWLWPFEGLEAFSILTAARFDEVFAAFVKEFNIGEAQIVSSATRRRGIHISMHDEVVDQLDILGAGPDGQLYIRCPFEAEHTSPSNEPDTCYFPAGTGGYQKGHFKCLHAHCTGRNDGEFLDALGLRNNMFGGVSKVDLGTPAPNLPALKRKKNGQIEATVDNLLRYLVRTDLIGMEIGLDDFKGVIMQKPTVSPQWVAFKDSDYTSLRQLLDIRGFAPVGRELIRDCVEKIAEQRRFDSARQWLDGVPAWDGTARVGRFLADYLGAEDSAYATAVSMYLWTALVGRIMQPGIKADMAVILSGPQGTGKSGMAKLLAPFEDAFAEISLSDGDDTLARRMRGKVAVEIGELKGLRNKEMEYVKAFVSRTHEEWVPKYKEFAQSYPRRCVFIGTTNQDEFLADSTGNRRWLPISVGKSASCSIPDEQSRGVHAFFNFQRLKLHFWAEAKVLFEKHGILAQEAEALARDVHDQHTLYDDWQTVVETWLNREELDGSKPADRSTTTIGDVLRQAVGIPSERITRAHQMRAADALKRLGWSKKTKRVDGVVSKSWVKEVIN